MGFESEQDLRETVLPILPSILDEENANFIEEFEYGAGRADIVAYRMSDCYLKRRVDELDLTSSIIDEKKLKEFLLIRGRGEISKEHYFSIGGRGKYQKSKALDWLIDEGFVYDYGDRIRTAPNLRRHITTAYSIELKLKNWKRALEQAHRGRSFSEYQYVVMDSDYISRALENSEKFENLGVGLVSVSDSGEYSIEIQSTRENPFSTVSKWRLNERTLSKASLDDVRTHARVAGD